MVEEPSALKQEGLQQKKISDQSTISENILKEDKCISSQSSCDRKGLNGQKNGEGPYQNHSLNDEPKTVVQNGDALQEDEENQPQRHETRVWIRCDVHDTGIGIPGMF